MKFFYHKFFVIYIEKSENTDLTYYQKKPRCDTK